MAVDNVLTIEFNANNRKTMTTTTVMMTMMNVYCSHHIQLGFPYLGMNAKASFYFLLCHLDCDSVA